MTLGSVKGSQKHQEIKDLTPRWTVNPSSQRSVLFLKAAFIAHAFACRLWSMVFLHEEYGIFD